MIHHFKSHCLSNLAEKLAELLESHQPEDPLSQQVIIVPNLDTSRWLKNRLAHKQGISANSRFILPSEWQWNEIRTLYPDLPKKLPSDPEPMKWVIFDLLSDPQILRRFSNLERYVASRGEDSKSGALFQLAAQLSFLFDQYQVYRPEMILKWQKGYSGTGDEKWQSELWRLFDKSIKKRRKGFNSLNRAELFLKILEDRPEISSKQDTLFVFNPGLVPKTVADLFMKTGLQSELFLFQIQPSELNGETENELLHSFGNEAGRIRFLYDSGDSKVSLNFSASDPETEVGKIQESIIRNKPAEEIKHAVKSLNGIEIRSCHSTEREIETLHQFLLEKFEEDTNLHPDDILVVSPNPEKYETAIHAVFSVKEGDQPLIPYHLSGSRSAGIFGVKGAFSHLLTLADSRFTFSDVMNLFSFKAVYDRFDLTEADVELIRKWMNENHVIWGLNAAHREEWGQPAQSIQTWHEALRRGWLGQWIDRDETSFVNDLLLFNGADTVSKQKVWAVFSGFLDDLDRFRKEVKSPKSGEEWADFFRAEMKRLFSEEALLENEAVQLTRSLDGIKEACSLAAFSGNIGFSEIRSEIQSALDSYSAGSANFNRGVVFSSMVPVRSIPFKVIALIGLNEDSFPRKPKVPEFDLMAQKPEPQDRNRKEEDRNLFLESILAAQSVHYCSYIGQSPVDNETIPPSSVVGEWVDFLAKISGQKPDMIIKKEPLTAFSPALFSGEGNFSGLSFKTLQTMRDDDEKISGLITEPIPPPEAEEVIEPGSLVHFAGNPIRWFLQNRFGIRFLNTTEEKDEFETDNLEKHLLFQRVFGWRMSGKSTAEMEKLLIQSGALPAGQAGKLRLKQVFENVEASHQVLKTHGFQPSSNYIDISISLSSNKLEGSIHTYSNSEYLSITASKVSGRQLVQSWIHHLIVTVSGTFSGDSYLITDLKSGKPLLFRFKPVEDPRDELNKYITLYQNGSCEPVYFFPGTLYAYMSEKKTGKTDARRKAIEAFEGSDWNPFSEKNDEYIQALMGDNAAFSDDFLKEEYKAMVGQMIDHMEEVK